MKARWVLFAAVIGLLALPLRAEAASPAPNYYVAMGDSYTAGPIIPLYEQPYGCLKSTNNYPHLVAAALQVPLRDVSCSGAETRHIFSPQGVTPGPNPPQLDAITADTHLVTIGISGNDIGFSGIAQDCVTLDPTTSPCRSKYVVNGVDEISTRIANVAPAVADVLQAIRANAAPDAKVFVVDYLPIFPEDAGTTCWPLLPVAWSDIPWLRDKEKELNGMLQTEANANGATFVDAYWPSVGHDSCEVPGLRWVEPLVPASPAAPIHPNLLGEKAYAAVVLDAIRGHQSGPLGILPPL